MKRYAIIDVETTGGRASRDKITEIGIVIYDGKEVVEAWESLINPECYIPYGITQLTGITQEMVQHAPKFYEVARQIVELTEKTIFVAHNVRFDYSFLQHEFRRLGYTFTRKQLCTVRLTRKVFPGLSSYSLGNLIRHFDIPTAARHRALADAQATAHLLGLIFEQQHSKEQVGQLINMGVKESFLPKQISLEQLHALPESCGVYYFHDEKGNVLYVGKSIHIKKRIFEHFKDRTAKGNLLQRQVHEITYQLTGSELIALLIESQEIKRLKPPINRAQKMKRFPFGIFSYTDKNGYHRYKVDRITKKSRKEMDLLSEHPKMGGANRRLKWAMEQYELCGRLAGQEKGNGTCFNFHLKKCRGACAELESPEAYNERAEEAGKYLTKVFDQDFYLLDQGRNPDELAVIKVQQSRFAGFGYLENGGSFGLEEIEDCIRPVVGNPETTPIIRGFLSKHPEVKCVPIPEEM